MTRKAWAVVAVLVAVIPGLLLVMVALGDKLARWGGYVDALAPLALFVLYVVGHMIVSFRPRRVRH